MSRRPPLACFAWLVALGLACTTPQASQPVVVGVHLIMPQGMLDNVEVMRLYVADATEETQCAEDTGLVTTDLTQQGAAQTFDLRRTTADNPCPSDATFCSEEITLPTDAEKMLVFQAIGFRSGEMYTVGCSSQAVNSNPFYVHLTVHRFIPVAQCGNGKIEPGEQCEPPGGDENCDDKCRSKEILLSNDHDKITNGPAKSKNSVALAWASGSPLHAVFQDTHFTVSTGPEINYRQLNADMQTVTSPALLAAQIRLLVQCTGTCKIGYDERQSTQAKPAIALLSDGSLLVAFEDSSKSASGESNITVTSISGDLKTVLPDEVYIDTTQGAVKLGTPAVAGTASGQGLVVWADSTSGAIRGRIWDTSKKWAGAPLTLAASGSSAPKVVGTLNGWRVVWQGAGVDAEDILYSDVTPDGSVAAPQTVNEKTSGKQSQPAIGALPSGESIIVWNDGGAIAMQRFGKDDSKIPGDQASPVYSDSTSESPSVVGSSLGGNFFAIVWQAACKSSDNCSSKIVARYADAASGFLFNPIDGQDRAFAVAYPDTANKGPRSLPAVAVGGTGYVAFAWQDDSANHFGIYARRFPLPDR